MNLDRMFQAGVALTVIGVVWSLWPQPGEAAYSSLNRRHRFTYRRGPAVLIDRAHWNRSAADPRFEGLSQLLLWDGYRVSRNRQEFVPELLRSAAVLVIPNALGWQGTLQYQAAHLGLRWHPRAFSGAEVAAVRDWVRGGGSLLLVADRSPAGEASQSLAAAFGAHLADCPSSDTATVSWFDRTAGLADHPIDSGRPDEGEDVSFVMSFGGGSVTGPPGSSAFLTVFPNATLRTGAAAPAACAIGKPQGLALEFGRGRVVLLAAQLARLAGLAQKAGIDDRLTDNRQLVLNIFHWLSRAQ